MSRGVSARNETRVSSVSTTSHAGVRRQSPETTTCVRPANAASIRPASAASAGFAYTRPAQTTVVSTPSTGRPSASAATERALPRACSRTSATGSASGGSCST